eukprot:UN02095
MQSMFIVIKTYFYGRKCTICILQMHTSLSIGIIIKWSKNRDFGAANRAWEKVVEAVSYFIH